VNNRNLPGGQNLHQNGNMRTWFQRTAGALLCGLALCVAGAQQEPQRHTADENRGRGTVRTLSADDGLSVIAAALDPKVRRSLYAKNQGRDCSHLVHAIYERAGFPYAYASSSDLYFGVDEFQRVTWPQPGDLVVWRGHVGIVIRPSRHVFFSYLREGPGVDDYQAPYWASRGHPRFYRYVK
jgi:cell wall-associated NlpC family hydrolase